MAVEPRPRHDTAGAGAPKAASEPARDFEVRLVELLHAASIEIAPDATRVEALHDEFDPGTEVFVNLPPGGDYRASVATAAALAKAGFRAVPHVTARDIASLTELDDFLARLTGDAGIERVLLIAGDRSKPRGPFASSLDMLATGRVERAGVRSIGIAGHPEGHPLVDGAGLAAALTAKRDYATKAGLELFIVTQFCFEAEPFLAFLGALDRLGIAAPVKIGVAGPATVATLVKFGIRCGVGNSLRALRMRTNTVGRLLGDAGPEDLLREVAKGLAALPSDHAVGIHFFAFGGIARTSAWIDGTLARLYDSIARKAAAG
jgi:methylenetetrahydrofolate reductase (NADPH)